MRPGPLRRGRENLTGIVSVLVTGIWLIALLTGRGWWLPFMLFGYIVLVPIVALLFGDEEDVEKWWEDEDVTVEAEEERGESESTDEALATLRERYARGELTDEQFERKVERLIETETVEDVEDRVRAERSRATDAEIESDRS